MQAAGSGSVSVLLLQMAPCLAHYLLFAIMIHYVLFNYPLLLLYNYLFISIMYLISMLYHRYLLILIWYFHFYYVL